MSRTLQERYREIQAIKERFLQKTAGLSYEQLNTPAPDGGWSPGQVLYHVAYAESGTILSIRKNMAENKVNRKSDIASIFRNLMLIVFLRSPMKFKAPKAVSKVPDSISWQELNDYYQKNHAGFTGILNELPETVADKFIFKHPVGGDFNIRQTLNFTREHYLHHEAQLDRLLNK